MIDDPFHKRPTLFLGESDEKPVQIPETIGGYKIESLLNKGGMSLLFLALHPETKEPLTIKVLSDEYLSHPEIVERFMQEAAIIQITNHPNIVTLYGHGRWRAVSTLPWNLFKASLLEK